MTTAPFDRRKARAFSGTLIDTLNKGSIAIMISLGHRSGLFDAMRGSPPGTSGTIARLAGLDERYVREWLGAMVTAAVVEYDPERKEYRLPPEHSAFLSRRAGGDNIASFMQYIAILGKVEDEILECFRKGGGVPYEKFTRFHEVMAEDSGQSVISALESHILPLVPGLKEKLERGIGVLDVGCGSGRIIVKLASLFPRSRFTGVDLSKEAIGMARDMARQQGLTNAEFIEKDVTDFHRSAPRESYDLITTFDAVHDQAKPMNVLRGIHRALKKDGVYLMQDISGTSRLEKDIDHPIAPFLYTISCMHCMTVSLAQGGEGLGAMWGEETTRKYLADAGFSRVETNKLDHDFQNNWYVVTK